MKIYKTNRGFKRIDFKDCYEEECSIQESSQAFVTNIWLGKSGNRMLLDKKISWQLVKKLLKFIIFSKL